MKTFYVLWTYLSNYSRLMPVDAKSAEDAIAASVAFFGEEFHKKATVFVFDKPPPLIVYKTVKFSGREHVKRYRDASRSDA